MNVVELQRALRQLRCSGIAGSLEARLIEAQAEKLAPIDFLSRLVQDELVRRQDRLLDRRVKQAGFRDVDKRLHPAAARSVLAHLIHMAETGRVRVDSGSEPATYRLA